MWSQEILIECFASVTADVFLNFSKLINEIEC